jgi:hypothetical protein
MDIMMNRMFIAGTNLHQTVSNADMELGDTTMPMQTTLTSMKVGTTKVRSTAVTIKMSITMTSTTTKEHLLPVSNLMHKAIPSVAGIQRRTPRPSATSP